MTDRKRDPLPHGYQYLDAGDGARVILLEADEWIVGKLPPNMTVHRKPAHWNVIEGEHTQ